jgi:putative membrane protein
VTAYTRALKQHLRGDRDLSEIRPLVSGEVFRRVTAAANPPAVLAHALSAWVRERQQAGELDAVTARALEGNVCSLVDTAANCERIGQTPIPFAYAVHIKQMLTLYLATLPFVLVPKMGLAAVFAVAGIAFGLVGIEEAGVEIEDPFGTDANDLPLEAFCASVAEDAKALAELPEQAKRAA